jgi:hypothetical protein
MGKGSTTGSGLGASEFAPGRNPGTASKQNPGRGEVDPPGQQMLDQKDDTNKTRNPTVK